MKIRLERSGKFLTVLFSHDELARKDLEGGPFRRRYGSSRGVTFTFEKRSKVYFLYVSFDRYKDARVLNRISSGRPVAELQMLSRLAHLPGAKIYVSEVPLPDGRNVDLIDTVKFEMRKVADAVWESGGIESEVDGLRRRMTLNSLKDRLPELYPEWGPDTEVATQAGSAKSEIIFAHRAKELKTPQAKKDLASAPKLDPGGQDKAPSERVLGPIMRSGDLPRKEEPRPQVNPAIVSEDRDPNEIAACDGCEELCYERELIEIKPGLYVCNSCTDDDTLRRLGLTPDEIDSFWRLMRCDWCGQPLTEVEPGRWLCPGCSLEKEVAPPPSGSFSAPMKRRPILGEDDLTPEFKKPTATDINKAIQLLLWRCRDAEIHKDKPQGKGGFYGLDDWIVKANDDMIRELGLWCADIQELNIGTRDS